MYTKQKQGGAPKKIKYAADCIGTNFMWMRALQVSAENQPKEEPNQKPQTRSKRHASVNV